LTVNVPQGNRFPQTLAVSKPMPKRLAAPRLPPSMTIKNFVSILISKYRLIKNDHKKILQPQVMAIFRLESFLSIPTKLSELFLKGIEGSNISKYSIHTLYGKEFTWKFQPVR
jgi:hypothetical protein